MKKRVVFLLSIIICINLTACGNSVPVNNSVKENKTQNEVAQVQDVTSNNKTAEKQSDITTNIIEVETDVSTYSNDEPNSELAIEYEEVIGDIDVSASDVTISDIVDYELGLDIPLKKEDLRGNPYLSMSDFSMPQITIPFPSAQFITNQTDWQTSIDGELGYSYFNVSAFIKEEDEFKSLKSTISEYGKYTLAITDKSEETFVGFVIYIWDSEANTVMQIDIAGGIRDNTELYDYWYNAIIDSITAQVKAAA